MATYATFMKLTEQGAKDIKAAPARVEAGITAFEQMGGKIIGFYVCQEGKYDYIAITDAPSDEVGKVFNMGLEAQGNVEVKVSTRVYSPKEFAELVSMLP
jgi:uncharacterized protein with GYD domain